MANSQSLATEEIQVPALAALPALSVRDLTVAYDRQPVLWSVDYVSPSSGLTAIIGPNGAGKSTLLKAIMGYLIPTAGQVHFAGVEITRMSTHQRVGQGLAFVPQLENVFPSLTVEENLLMGGYGFAADKRLLRERMDAQYERFPRLAERRRQRVRTMSGGERQMLALARALMTEPRMLLLDEPSAALSPKIADEVFAKVKEINAQGRTIVIVEQNADSSLRISDRGVVLADGRNAFEGPADHILHDEKIREAYLGTAEA